MRQRWRLAIFCCSRRAAGAREPETDNGRDERAKPAPISFGRCGTDVALRQTSVQETAALVLCLRAVTSTKCLLTVRTRTSAAAGGYMISRTCGGHRHSLSYQPALFTGAGHSCTQRRRRPPWQAGLPAFLRAGARLQNRARPDIINQYHLPVGHNEEVAYMPDLNELRKILLKVAEACALYRRGAGLCVQG